jgi:hypothetical protein
MLRGGLAGGALGTAGYLVSDPNRAGKWISDKVNSLKKPADPAAPPAAPLGGLDSPEAKADVATNEAAKAEAWRQEVESGKQKLKDTMHAGWNGLTEVGGEIASDTGKGFLGSTSGKALLGTGMVDAGSRLLNQGARFKGMVGTSRADITKNIATMLGETKRSPASIAVLQRLQDIGEDARAAEFARFNEFPKLESTTIGGGQTLTRALAKEVAPVSGRGGLGALSFLAGRKPPKAIATMNSLMRAPVSRAAKLTRGGLPYAAAAAIPLIYDAMYGEGAGQPTAVPYHPPIQGR